MARANHFKVLTVMATALLVAGLLMLLAAGKPAQAAFPGSNGAIAFVSDRDGNDEIYAMNSDGTAQNNLTNNPRAHDFQPAVSPDGTKIAFVSKRDDPNPLNTAVFGGEIYVMNADGTEQTRLTKNPGSDLAATDLEPAWSRDGDSIVFRSNRSDDDGTTDGEIYMMKAKDDNKDGNGDGLKQLTDNAVPDTQPVYSPNEDRIAFLSRRNGSNMDVFVMDTDPNTADDAINLTRAAVRADSTPALDQQPNWAPDGNKIAFMSDRDSTDRDSTGRLIFKNDVFVMDTDPTTDDAINLTGHEASPQANDRLPAFSPDGRSIAFTSNRPVVGGDSDVFVVDNDPTTPDDVNPLNLTDNSPQGDIKPDWGRGPDTTKPNIMLMTPVESDTYTLNQTVTADYECADEGGSGLAACVGDVSDGASIDTSSVGPKTFTVTATDNAGNTYSVTHNYSVVYEFGGFFSPVDNFPTFNSTKAGSAKPMKFGLSGDQGLNILADGYPKSEEIPCDSTVQVDGVEETVTANKSGLTFDPTSDEYTYVWKTEKAWVGTCRQLVVKLNDGTLHRANFQLK